MRIFPYHSLSSTINQPSPHPDYYGDTFFESAGTTLSPYAIQCILGGVSVAGTIPALILIERWGRRRSLLVGSVWEAAAALIAALVGHYVAAGADVLPENLTKSEKMGDRVLDSNRRRSRPVFRYPTAHSLYTKPITMAGNRKAGKTTLQIIEKQYAHTRKT